MTTTATENELREALGEFIAASGDKNSTGDGRRARLAAAFERVMNLEAKLPASVDPMLRHYMERRSYQKAFDFLNSGRPETETPQCGH